MYVPAKEDSRFSSVGEYLAAYIHIGGGSYVSEIVNGLIITGAHAYMGG